MSESENLKEIKKIINKLKFKNDNELEEILNKKKIPQEIFFKNLSNEIIMEIKNIDNINNNENIFKRNFFNYNKNLLYLMLKVFIIKKNNINNEVIENFIKIENIETIISTTVNINNKSANSSNEEINKYNKNIIDLITTFMILNPKLFIENIILLKDNILINFLLILTKSKNGRKNLYDFVSFIFLFFPDFEKYKIIIDFMNNTIDYISQQLKLNNFIPLLEETQLILYYYKNHINSINNSMSKLLIKIFAINENNEKGENKEKNNNDIYINNLLRYCFDRIVFIFSDKININYNENKEMKSKKNFTYNKDFMNFLLEMYQELVNHKLTKSYTDFLMELFLGIDNIGTGTKKYIWLINETKYPQIVLQSIIELKDSNILSLYFSKISFLSVPNSLEYYLPEFDIIFFISRLRNILNSENEEGNEKILNIITSQIINLININKINIKNDIIDILLNKCDLINVLVSIIYSNDFSKNIKTNLINFLENILSFNKSNINYTLNIPIAGNLYLDNHFDINNINSYGINYRLYLLSLKYEINRKEYNKKLYLVLNIMYHYFENKKILEIVIFGEILLKSILMDDKFIFINEFSRETIKKIRNIYKEISIILFQNTINEHEKEKSFDILNKFLSQIFNFIYEFNKKCLIFKKSNKCKYSQIIFDENFIYIILKNLFMKLDDFSLKKKIISKLFKIDFQKELIDNKLETCNKYIVSTPHFSIIIITILYEIKDYQNLFYLYNNLFELVNYSIINIKIILNFDIIDITLKILINLYIDKLDVEENENNIIYKKFYNILFSLLKILLKFASQSSLIKYLSNIFSIFFDSLIENNNKNDKYKEIIKKLFSILKENLNPLIKFQKQNYQYLSISKKYFNNPFIYNIFYINNLKRDEAIMHYNIDIRINSFDNIENFWVVNFINEKINQSLFISINNKNQLIVGEKAINQNQINQLASFENINEFLPADNNFHNISIIIDIENKNIKILVDYKYINHYKTIINYNNFLFNDFNIIIGYDYDIVHSFNSKCQDENVSIIDISNIILLNYRNDVDNYFLNTMKEDFKKNYVKDNILEELFLNKKEYYYKFVLAEICFNLNNIKIINNKKIIKNACNLSILNKYLFKDDIEMNKYISYIDIINPFTNLENINIYMISANNNIENYLSANEILQLQNINKIISKNIFYENFNIFYSSSNYLFLDFLIGFLFDIDKRNEYIIKNSKTEEENNIENTIEKNNTILKDKYINECIIMILDIILNLQNTKNLNYFLYKKENISIKIKYFFKKNIYLLNDKEFLIDLIELLNKKIEYLLIFGIEIFLDLLIFQLLDFEIQNIILIAIKKVLENPIKGKENIKNKNKYALNEDISPMLYKLLEKFYNLILYYELSVSEIKDSNNDTIQKRQVDIIIFCILCIFQNIDKQNNNKYEIKVKDLSINIINICSKLQESIQTHGVKEFLEKYNIIINKNNIFIDNCYINTQIELLTNSISKYLSKLISKQKKNETTFTYIEDNENNNIINVDLNQKYFSNNKDNFISSVNDSDRNDSISNSLDLDGEENYEQDINITFSKNCCFCLYLFSYFKIKFDAIYEEIKYEKYKKEFYRNIFINFDEHKTKLGINNYAWYLSQNESSHRIQNKFFIKENKIKIIGNNEKNDLYKYKYINDIDKYTKTIIELNKIFLYDNISIDHHFLDLFKYDSDDENNIILAENCLLINNIIKTNSLFLIYNDYLLIITNICVDNENKLHVAFDEFNMNIWCIKNEEYISELDNYIKNNEKHIIKNFFDKNDKVKSSKKDEFGYDKNYKFKIKKVKFSQINEIHKTSYLQIPNSIEIITNKGKTYFLCFNIEKRDFIFSALIENIAYLNLSEIKKNKIKKIISRKVNKTNIDDCFYLKNCPMTYLENSKDNTLFSYLGVSGRSLFKKIININPKIKINKKEIYNKAIVDKNIFLNEICNFWIKNKISNFDYLMLLNSLSGRSLINLSQYFIFPYIIKEYDHTILNWLNESIYRDLSFPIFACSSILKKDLSNLDIKKFEVNEIGTKYHSGTFYSTHAFVSYFLIRQHPFTELHLEIQGGEFDSANRLFIGSKELSNLEERYQELIPNIFTLPELYINTNNFIFGKIQGEIIENAINREVNDFVLPKWSGDDPRKFILVLKKLLESKKISENINYWIDLIFGYKMNGIEAIKSFNTYRKACYPINMEEMELLNKNNELLSILLEKQELGYMGKQLFKKSHKNKEIISDEFKENENMFFDNFVKLKNIKFIEINKEIDIKSEKISIINNIMFQTKNEYINNTMNKKNYYHQGGVSSLNTIINIMVNDYNISSKNTNLNKIINAFEKDSNLIALEKNNIFIGDPINNIVLQYNKRIIKILYNNFKAYSFYYLKEIENISIIICNQKGTKLYVGFDNGDILIYRIRLFLKNNPFLYDKNYIYPFKTFIPINNESINSNTKKRGTGSFKIKRNEIDNNNLEIIAFEKISNNNFVFGNPRIPQKIEKINIDEENNILIATTSINMIYIISLNNNFRIMHIIPYFTKDYYNYKYKIKDIVPLNNNGDFIIYSSLTVHLFSINGIPICDLNLLDKFHNKISPITYCVGIFLYDVILFTGHKDGSIYIWKVINKDHSENFNERASSFYNDEIKKSFLPEYKYGYSFNFNAKDIKDFELRRKFDSISKIIDQNISSPIKYMKMSNDMSYMIVLTENKKTFILSNFEDDNNDMGNTHKKKKIFCCWCKNEIEDSYFRTTYITSLKNIIDGDNDDDEFEVIDNLEGYENNEDEEKSKKKKNVSYICEHCKNKLVHIENYLYNY